LALAGRLGRWKEAVPDLRSPGTAAFYASSAIALVFVFLAVWPQSVASFDPTVNDLPLRHVSPGHVDEDGRLHLLGTDHLGRDVWSRLVWGARASLMVGASGLVLGGIVGISLGLLAGYRGGWTDRIAMRIVDAFLSFPYILIAIVWAALIGTDLKSLILIVAVRGWVEFCRVVRGQALSIRERDYVSAALAVGATD
jgi:peptide/nickel transport system permease protein